MAVGLCDPVIYSSDADASLPSCSVPETAAVTRHILLSKTDRSRHFSYTANAGHLTARASNGDAQASIFYVAYTVDQSTRPDRPVTFFFNGGPGESSIWLHLGSWGPYRVQTGMPDSAVTTFSLTEAEDTLLTESDLVFIDAPATGYSEAIAPNTNQTFMNESTDAMVFRDFILRYLSANQRMTSPVYLYGESYGGYRACLVAQLLVAGDKPLNGLILQSPALSFMPATESYSVDSLPTVAAIATYFGRSDKPDTMGLDSYLRSVQQFAVGPFARLARQYEEARRKKAIPPVMPPEMLKRLEGISGLNRALLIEHFPYFGGILALDFIPGKILDSYDARIVMPRSGDLPLAYQCIRATQPAYFSNFLQYHGSTPYVFHHDIPFSSSSPIVDPVAGRGRKEAVSNLSKAISLRPGLKVLAITGMYDLIVPFTSVENALADLGKREMIQILRVEGGHMSYLADKARPVMRRRLRSFYR
ncbi:S10 family serine carboxypeptidase-like protein [Chromobacterium sp. CV08]|uniref:S10 family serine carboxypeptidase-like protein n=1 Tax=Chromobacterium sp. CV08 TaxID=3133274 RepID=UPI003DA7EEAF